MPNRKAAVESNGDNPAVSGVRDLLTGMIQPEEPALTAQRRLQLALEGAEIGTWEINTETGECRFDERIAHLLGFGTDRRDCTLDEFLECVHPEDRKEEQRLIEQAVKGTGDYENEFRILLPDGKLRWLVGKGVPVRRPDGSVHHVIGINFDITPRKEAQEELLRAKHLLEQRVDEQTRELRVISHNVPAFFSYVDKDLRYRFINRLYEEKFGMKPGEFIGRPVKEVFGNRDYPEIERRLRAALRGEDQEFEITLEIPHGRIRVLRARFLPRPDGGEGHDGVFVLASDITAERRLQQEILEASEREKERIGRDLHDSLCQELGGIGMSGKAVASALRRKGVPEAEHVERLVRQINDATLKARMLARGLSPVVLENRSLPEALEDLAENITGLYDGLDCVFSNRSRDLDLEKPVATQLYFIAREAAYNATRHARPRHVAINLRQDGDNLALSVIDDGGGRKSGFNEGMGIRSMRYRARTLGGQLTIGDSPAGNGLEVVCRLNLKTSP